jgi:DNA helicase-2/ATP-dependent DNA helicase PcrA
LDYDDQLIQSVRVLTEDPNLLAKLQMQYKCLLVDEAQDLNVVQHHLFGLIAGATDPRTLAPRKDGKLSAGTFAFIGDDKQAIYEFRGANPDHFIEKSDMGPVKGEYKTLLLDKNFRSGSAIVDAANKLIKYNTKQIPMVCTTDPKKGEGTILRERIGFEDEGPDVMVRQILGDLDTIKSNDGVIPKDFYKRYGLAARTNREILAYQMALIGAGIPFRSKRNPLEGPALGPIVAVCRMFLPSATVDVRNKGFLAGLKMPDIGVGYVTVRDRLLKADAGDFYQFCKDGGYSQVYSASGKGKPFHDALKNYSTKYLPELEALVTKGSSKDFLDVVLTTAGTDGQSFIDQLALEVRNSEEDMEEAQALADQDDGDGIITDDILRQQAAKPLEPLFKLAQKYPKTSDFIGYLDSLAMQSTKTVKTDDEAQENDNLVTLDTVHGWKGLECDNLFVPMAEGRFPIVRPDSPNPERAMESERRLAYVALTRGAHSVTIIEPTMRMKGDKVVKLNPSQFVTEACIQVKGKVPTAAPPVRTASVEDALKTGDVTPFLMPVLEDEDSGSWGESMYEQDPMPEHLELEDDLEAQWGDYLLGSEEN